jgi:hypothetical protein
MSMNLGQFAAAEGYALEANLLATAAGELSVEAHRLIGDGVDVIADYTEPHASSELFEAERGRGERPGRDRPGHGGDASVSTAVGGGVCGSALGPEGDE